MFGLLIIKIHPSFIVLNVGNCVCLHSESYGVARQKAKKAENTSDIDTASSEVEKEASRERRIEGAAQADSGRR